MNCKQATTAANVARPSRIRPRPCSWTSGRKTSIRVVVASALVMARTGHHVISADAFGVPQPGSHTHRPRGGALWDTTTSATRPTSTRPSTTKCSSTLERTIISGVTTSTPTIATTAKVDENARDDARDGASGLLQAAEKIGESKVEGEGQGALSSDDGVETARVEEGEDKSGRSGGSRRLEQRGRSAVRRATSRLFGKDFASYMGVSTVSQISSDAGPALSRRRSRKGLDIDEEEAVVHSVKTLALYHKVRDSLEANLGRHATDEEWAASIGISEDKLLKQVDVSLYAQERIIESNIGLIILTARKHHPRIFVDLGVSKDDVVQEGSMALLRAAETFDPKMGCRFATYAVWWVRDGVQRCVTRQSRLIRLPQHVHNFIRTTSRSAVELRDDLGREPTYEELAKHMHVDVARVRRYTNCPDALSMEGAPRNSGGRVGSSGGGFVSAGQATGGVGSGAGYRHETVACSGTTPEQRAEMFLFQNKLNELMSVLSPDERLVVSLRYGLDGAPPTTVSELAEIAGASKYRVQRVESRALNKLRRPASYNRLARGRKYSG